MYHRSFKHLKFTYQRFLFLPRKLLDLIFPLAGGGLIRCFFHIHHFFRGICPQVSRSVSLAVLVPPTYDMVGAPGIKAAIGASDDVYKPGVHWEEKIILL